LKLKKAEIVICEPTKTEPLLNSNDVNFYHVDAALIAPLSPSSSIQSSISNSENALTQEMNAFKSKELDEATTTIVDKNNNETPGPKLQKESTPPRRNSIGLSLLKNIEASMDKEENEAKMQSNLISKNESKNYSPSSSFMSRRASFDTRNLKKDEQDPLVESILKFRQLNEAKKTKEVTENFDRLKLFQKSPSFMDRRATFDYTSKVKSSLGDSLNEINQKSKHTNDVEINKNVYSPFKTSGLINYAQNDRMNGNKQSLINVNILLKFLLIYNRPKNP
jgi:hypothetical protein